MDYKNKVFLYFNYEEGEHFRVMHTTFEQGERMMKDEKFHTIIMCDPVWFRSRDGVREEWKLDTVGDKTTAT